ncbi:MAG: isoleucine--tRNA ligase [Pseudomonadota bacterium]|nr:isoleucine--tRNA ligase [Pseudomonadota bacterium]
MGRYTELKTPAELEAEVLAFWKDRAIFQQSLAASRGKPRFVFYEGPPTANGMPHNGHVLTRVMKDLIPRYRTMRGYHVPRMAGWDTHGLPVEVEVEKELGIHGKAAIEEFGVEPFATRCIQSVFRYTTEWEELTDRVGFWLDTSDAYATYHRSYVESVWWALSKLFEKGLLYQDYKVVWWWPQGGTALSSGEVGEGYKTVDDPSVTIRFPVKGQPGTSFLAWTTTPWTLPSNVALAVNPNLDYAFVRHVGADGQSELLIVAEGLREQVEGEVEKVVKGSDLVGLEYEPPYRFEEPTGGKSYVVVPGAHVTLGAGTGIVHTAPAFGEDDFASRREHDLGFLQLVAPDGTFVTSVTPWAGRFCKEADKDIVRDLEERRILFKKEVYRHEYPFCPRAENDPLIQYARPAWFIRTTALKDAALANNAAVNWLPETIKEGRFGDFLRNNVDWALSRERFWGTPLNIWSCAACGARVAPASAAEIARRNPDAFDPSVDADLQVHKPWIDRVTLPCDACGGTMQRVPEVIDCWFDSGCMPFAQHGFPHKGQEEFKAAFPADFISEAVDQTRGWFYSLLMISTLLFDDETCRDLGLDPVGYPRPYRNCVVLGHVCDVDGKKESKSKGNYTSPDLVLKGWMKAKVVEDPSLKPGQVGFKGLQVKSLGLNPDERLRGVDGTLFEVVARPVKGKDTVNLHPEDAVRLAADGTVVLHAPFPAPGADAFRWLFYASNPPWNNTRISLKAILEGQREFLFRLKNVHQFYVLNAGDHVPAPPTGAHLLDKWVLSELDTLVRDTTRWLDAYRLYEPARAIQTFVEGLSNWWLRRSRDRFDDVGTWQDACDTLHHVLLTLSGLTAPFVPFMAEAMYRSLVPASRTGEAAESVHLTAWPTPDDARQAPELSEHMALVRELASLGLSARTAVGVRVRQPLAAAEIVLARSETAEALANLVELLRDELNVREVRFSADATRFVKFKVKPDFKALGARLGKDMKACAAVLATLDGGEVRARVLAGGLTVELPSGPVTLGSAEIVTAVEPLPGFQASGSANAVVALHAALDEDLLEEGLAREVISRVQIVRKQWGLAYSDVVRLGIAGGPRTDRMVARFQEQVGTATGGRFLPIDGGEQSEIVIDGETLTLTVARA